MKFLIIACLLFSNTVFAKSFLWNDLEEGYTYSLSEKIVLKAKDSAETLILENGESYTLTAWTPLDEIRVQLLEFQTANCKSPDFESEIAIVIPRTAANDPSVGVQMNVGCVVQVFVENKDLKTESLFDSL